MKTAKLAIRGERYVRYYWFSYESTRELLMRVECLLIDTARTEGAQVSHFEVIADAIPGR